MTQIFAGLDVSDANTALCLLEDDGTIVAEGSVVTDARAIVAYLAPYRRRLAAVGIETQTSAAWLSKQLQKARLPVVLLDARRTHAALSAQLNKTDQNDARGIAKVLCRGLYTRAYLKSDAALELRSFLTLRRALKRKAAGLQVTLNMCAQLLGGKLAGRREHLSVKLPARSKNRGFLVLAAPIIRAISALDAELEELDREAARRAKTDRVCRRLMTVPGVGPITALTFMAAVDDPTRFPSSRAVAAYFGLTPRRFQSGSIDIMGKISRRGDREVRAMLFDAAHVLLCVSKSRCPLRLWGLKLAERKGWGVATVACARKLAVLLHSLWVNERDFENSPA